MITPVWTDEAFVDIDQIQYSFGEGPCLDAIRCGREFYAAELETDRRWPTFGPAAAARGMNSLLSLVLEGRSSFGSLNLYSRRRHAYSNVERAAGAIYAIQAGLALSATTERARAERVTSELSRRTAKLRSALTVRDAVRRAEGILMQRYASDAQEAFGRLLCYARQFHKPMQVIAQQVVECGDIPSQRAS